MAWEQADVDQLRAQLDASEAALRRERSLVRLISETTPVGIVTLDSDGQITSANRWAEDLLGLSRAEITGRTYNDPRWRITDCEGGELPDDELPFRRVLQTGNPVQDVRHALLWPDGRRVFLSISAAPVTDDDGHIVAVLAVFDNITERVASQEKLEASERRYRGLFNSMQDAFSLQEIIHDDSGAPCDYRFLEVNPAFEALTGIPADEWIGRTVKEVLPDTEPHWIELCGEVARTGTPVRVEQYAQAFDRYYEVLAYCPAPNQCAALSTDVTERKRAQDSLLQRSRLDATATLAGGVAHDLNNLMVSVLGTADLLRQQRAGDAELAARLDEIVEAGQQAGRLAQQMLSFARPTQPNTEVVDPVRALEETLSIQRSSIPPRISIETDVESQLWKVKADRAQMVQVLMNLCINAAEAIEGYGRVRIRASNVRVSGRPDSPPSLPAGRYVMLSVEDDGHGIEPTASERIFDPFFSTKQQGRGLGLAAVHGIVTSHGGDIVVSSDVGRGTTFDVYWPATDEPIDDVEALADRSLRGSETVLLIDDEARILHTVGRILESMGYAVLRADSGAAAVAIAKEHDGAIHAAILDLGMPVMGGKEVFSLLRAARPETKVIVCSGYDRHGDADKLLETGADAFVKKPFLIEELLAPLREILAR